MNSLIITLLIILIFLLAILIGIAIFLIFKLVINKNNTSPETTLVIQKSESQNPKGHQKISDNSHCPNHKENSAIGTCLICEEAYCEECLIEHDSLYFCKEHFRTYADSKWDKITDILTTAETPEASMFIYDFKRDIWKYEKIPTFVLTHYKINVGLDLIESYVQLHVRINDLESLAKRLSEFKKK